MKINLTLDVSDDLRRAIGTLTGLEVTQEGLATREAVIAYIRTHLAELNTAVEGFAFAIKPSADSLSDYEQAIEYLRAAGYGDTHIKRWIFKQQARRDLLDKKLG